MAIVQAPFIYYYSTGLSSFLIVSPYLAAGMVLTIWLGMAIANQDSIAGTRFHRVALFTSVAVGSITFFFGESIVEKLDWNLRRSSRDQIVQLVKDNQLNPNAGYNEGLCALRQWNLPPISTGGNEIVISKTDENRITVEFYINRGFLDHCSAFVYTDDPKMISELDNRVNRRKGSHGNMKLDENWYRVAY
jgi:hypothetical protein